MNWQKAWDMKKIELILQPNQFTSFASYYLEEYWRRHLDISIYDPRKTYEKSGTVFVFWWTNADDDLPTLIKDQGHHVAIDNLWELPTNRKDFYWIEHLNWFRLNESLWWQALGYDQYRPNKNLTHRAFVPMRRCTTSRDLLYKKIQNQLDQCIWSYQDKTLPDDLDDPTHGEWQRFMNPAWYDSTYCSIVAETQVDRVWITEKSFKPIAFFHPFMILSHPGHIKNIQCLGFETFDNIFDESYDDILDLESRCQVIIDNLLNVDWQRYDHETQRRLQYNHDHFFDKILIEDTIKKEIVDPLIEYAET